MAKRTKHVKSATPLAPQDGVIVRMYRQGLGDCFLLAFAGQPEPFYLLIDCGVLLGTAEADTKMQAVAQDIIAATGGHLHVLVATHEHWDHVSGFVQARELFDQMTIDAVWLAWTEDRTDQLANHLRLQRLWRHQALSRAVEHLQQSQPAMAERIEAVLGFAGSRPAAAGATTGDAMQYLLNRGGKPRFCYPGEDPIALPQVPGTRVFVLGPPRDESLLHRSNPRGQEGYGFDIAQSSEAAFYAAALAHGEATPLPPAQPGIDDDAASKEARPPYGFRAEPWQIRELCERSQPFEEQLRIAPDDAKDKVALKEYFDDDAKWRRIDDDWLGFSGPLALRLDNDTNNTSLVLAIELSPGGNVLLFAADAQAGNWLSWQSLAWPDAGRGAKPLTAADLLRRTVLYKVGHHASHNATLRDQGLELMTSCDLVAMIPVDEAMARQRHWQMPFKPLLARLQEKTYGRVLCADQPWPSAQATAPANISAKEWESFKSRVTSDPENLYVQYAISH